MKQEQQSDQQQQQEELERVGESADAAIVVEEDNMLLESKVKVEVSITTTTTTTTTTTRRKAKRSSTAAASDTSDASSPGTPSGRKLRSRAKQEKINYNEDAADDELFGREEKLSKADLKLLEEEEDAAEAAGFNPGKMDEHELAAFPEYADNEMTYVEIRNTILAAWQRNVRKFLSRSECMKTIKETFADDVNDIYDYLMLNGHINIGVFDTKAMDKDVHPQTIAIIGGGMAGLAAARQLSFFGFKVILIEARDRVGGRCHSVSAPFGGAVDMGAMVVTGLQGNPFATLCTQLKQKLHIIEPKCVIYDVDGKPVPEDVDSRIEKNFNTLLDIVSEPKLMAKKQQNGDASPSDTLPKRLSPAHSLGMAIEYFLKHGMKGKGDDVNNLTSLLPQEKRVLDWHIANLEYACATELSVVSLHEWDQDDEYEFGGAHCLLPNGYSAIAKELTDGIDVRYESVVKKIEYDVGSEDCNNNSTNNNATKGARIHIVRKNSAEPEIIDADAVLVTLPLGVLKAGDVEFSPPLPSWKTDAIQRLGFGLLNKLALRFPKVFWEANSDSDYFGHATDDSQNRGEFYLFWNMQRCMGQPVLMALIAGNAAHNVEGQDRQQVINRCMSVLRKIFGPGVPDPVDAVLTNWYSDPFARGSYSYISVDSKGEDYDIMAQPVGRTLYFAGEATIRQHPATAAGAFLSGVREAGRIYRTFVPRPQRQKKVTTPKQASKQKRRSRRSTDKDFVPDTEEVAEAPVSKKRGRKRGWATSNPREATDSNKKQRQRSANAAFYKEIMQAAPLDLIQSRIPRKAHTDKSPASSTTTTTTITATASATTSVKPQAARDLSNDFNRPSHPNSNAINNNNNNKYTPQHQHHNQQRNYDQHVQRQQQQQQYNNRPLQGQPVVLPARPGPGHLQQPPQQQQHRPLQPSALLPPQLTPASGGTTQYRPIAPHPGTTTTTTAVPQVNGFFRQIPVHYAQQPQQQFQQPHLTQFAPSNNNSMVPLQQQQQQQRVPTSTPAGPMFNPNTNNTQPPLGIAPPPPPHQQFQQRPPFSHHQPTLMLQQQQQPTANRPQQYPHHAPPQQYQHPMSHYPHHAPPTTSGYHQQQQQRPPIQHVMGQYPRQQLPQARPVVPAHYHPAGPQPPMQHPQHFQQHQQQQQQPHGGMVQHQQGINGQPPPPPPRIIMQPQQQQQQHPMHHQHHPHQQPLPPPQQQQQQHRYSPQGGSGSHNNSNYSPIGARSDSSSPISPPLSSSTPPTASGGGGGASGAAAAAAAADSSSSDDPAIQKKQFRDELASAVTKMLNKYMDKGKIATREDFKHLARKLTHTIMEKEERHCNAKGTPLAMNKHVRIKTQEYVDSFFAGLKEPYHRNRNSSSSSSKE